MAKVRGRPVDDFDIEYEWYDGVWKSLFDEQIALLREDLYRARVADRFVIYLSCPISSRGGGWSAVNVEIAQSTERKLVQRFGEKIWVLNPAQYQMESKEGTGLIKRHARKLGISDQELEQLMRTQPLGGGDYMRMWTKVLVEDDPLDDITNRRIPVTNSGRYFDSFYFVGPSDIASFFGFPGVPGGLAGAVESYFARRFSTDPDFRDAFSIPDIRWGDPSRATNDQMEKREDWEARRKNLIRYYSLKAGAAFSKGSHDEWNIAAKINKRRMEGMKGDVGELLPIYSDGVLIDLSAFEALTRPGYAL